MKRLFIALDIPPNIASSLNILSRGIRGARWINTDQFHLTLCFIGRKSIGVQTEIELALSQVSGPPMDIKLRGVGYFPPREPIKVLWVGLDPEPLLHTLQKKLVTCMTKLSVNLEKRKFVPHVTLARFRKPPPTIHMTDFLTSHSLFTTEKFTVSQFHLYSSHLRQEGAIHIKEASYILRHPQTTAFGQESY